MKIPQNILPNSTFACGPSQALKSVENTPLVKTLFEKSHRSPDLAQKGLYRETTLNIKKLFNLSDDYTILFFPGGATAAMDAVVWTLTNKSISGLVFGSFSKRWIKDSNFLDGIKKTFVNFDYKKENYRELDFKASLILLTLNETSHGIRLPEKILKDIYTKKSKDTLVAWDATSWAGMNEVKPYFDIMLFSTQKAFGSGGGTCVLIMNKKAIKRAQEMQKIKKIPFFLNLNNALHFAPLYQTLNTPSTINIWMLNEGVKYMLKHGGLKKMEALTKAHAKVLLDYAKKSNWLTPMTEKTEFCSKETLTLKITDDKIKDTLVNKALKQTKKRNLADGIKKFSSISENSLRIACFPFIDPKGTSQFKKLTKTLDYIAKHLDKNLKNKAF
ncbi:MAG: aminotransferase class V-fold PLP-dependent enzyme [Elusimicrobiaceae bacterium]|nr:aminotransferase class V-fold PLP-dependent enzyme [Elusimicrobiaceae bacterium]